MNINTDNSIVPTCSFANYPSHSAWLVAGMLNDLLHYAIILKTLKDNVRIIKITGHTILIPIKINENQQTSDNGVPKNLLTVTLRRYQDTHHFAIVEASI